MSSSKRAKPGECRGDTFILSCPFVPFVVIQAPGEKPRSAIKHSQAASASEFDLTDVDCLTESGIVGNPLPIAMIFGLIRSRDATVLAYDANEEVSAEVKWNPDATLKRPVAARLIARAPGQRLCKRILQ